MSAEKNMKLRQIPIDFHADATFLVDQLKEIEKKDSQYRARYYT